MLVVQYVCVCVCTITWSNWNEQVLVEHWESIHAVLYKSIP